MIEKSFSSSLVLFCIFATLFSIGGCGGGSAGTGTGDNSLRIQGTVTNNAGTPIEGATVTVVETGEFDTTDASGSFLIVSGSSAENLTLEISKDDRSALTTISAPGENGTISIQVKFDDVREIVEKNELSVEAKIVGSCDRYFENFQIIRQANPTPGDISCVVKVVVKAAGELVPHVPISIQFRRCSASSPWTTSALGATMSAGNIGVAQISFDFSDDQKHCLYRVVTPFGEETVKPVITDIQTFTWQNAQSN